MTFFPSRSRRSVVESMLMLGVISVAFPAVPAEAQQRTRNVILVTLDGARTEEIFGGLDLAVLRSSLSSEGDADSTEGDVDPSGTESYSRYWAETPGARRERLMPFFWRRLMMNHGSIAGNHALGSRALISNRHRFSYPGYSEILTGQAHDDVIHTNDPVRNPYPSVLEFLRQQLALPASQVATFASWSIFNWIVEHEEGATTTNAGFEPYDHPDPAVRLLSSMQFETPTPWDTVRHDAYTFRLGMAHLRTYRPRVLYLALGDDDDWAHDRRYDRYLDSLARADRYLEMLWEFVQADEQYRDSTTLVITVDHGRGRTPADWTDHGGDVDGAQDVWVAFVSPDAERRGEWSSAPTIRLDQIAATLSRFLGLDFSALNPTAGAPIDYVFQP